MSSQRKHQGEKGKYTKEDEKVDDEAILRATNADLDHLDWKKKKVPANKKNMTMTTAKRGTQTARNTEVDNLRREHPEFLQAVRSDTANLRVV